MAEPRRGVVAGGTWCVDRNKMVEYWPGEDGLVEILQVEARGGGPGCNLALDMRKLDPAMPVWTIGVVGDDPDGRLLVQEAENAGVEHSQLVVRGGEQDDVRVLSVGPRADPSEELGEEQASRVNSLTARVEADAVVVARLKRAGERVGPVADPRRRIDHLLPPLLGDARAGPGPVQDDRGGRFADAHRPGDVL